MAIAVPMPGLDDIVNDEDEPRDDAHHSPYPSTRLRHDDQRQDGGGNDRKTHDGVETLQEVAIGLRTRLAQLYVDGLAAAHGVRSCPVRPHHGWMRYDIPLCDFRDATVQKDPIGPH